MRNYAMLGKWHVHAEQYANEINRLDNCRITKVWDPSPETASAWAEKLAPVAREITTSSRTGVIFAFRGSNNPQKWQSGKI